MLENEIYGERTMRTSLIALLAAVLVPFALTSPAAAAPGVGVSLSDGVVVDGARSIAYVMHPQGGVEALDLQSGSSLWRSSEAERPLALAGDLLIAQGRPGEHGELRIVALDVLHKGAGSAEADLPMPAGVRAEASETLRQAFHVTASASQQGVVVAWRAQLRRAFAGRGASETDAERKTAGETGEGRLQGNALFDPHAGSLLPLEAPARVPWPPPASPRRTVFPPTARTAGSPRPTAGTCSPAVPPTAAPRRTITCGRSRTRPPAPCSAACRPRFR